MDLNTLILELIQIRDENPNTGKNPVTIWVNDGTRYEIGLIDTTVENIVELNATAL